MDKMVRKGLLLGIGLASFTRDEIEKQVKDLVEEGNLSEKEGRALLKDVLKHADKNKETLRAMVNKELDIISDKLTEIKSSSPEERNKLIRKEISVLRNKVSSINSHISNVSANAKVSRRPVKKPAAKPVKKSAANKSSSKNKAPKNNVYKGKPKSNTFKRKR